VTPLLRSVRPADVDVPLAAFARHPDAPRAAADLAVLHERSANIRLDVDLDLLSAVGTGHQKVVVH
jgi:hypothetical protein